MAWSDLFSKNKPDVGGKNPSAPKPPAQPPAPTPVARPNIPVKEVTVPGMGRVSVRKRVADTQHPTFIPPQQINVPERFRSTIRPQRPPPTLPIHPTGKSPATVPLRIDLPPATTRAKFTPQPHPVKVETPSSSPIKVEEPAPVPPAISGSISAPAEGEIPLTTAVTGLRRRKMNEVAKVVLPPRREVVVPPEPAPAAPTPTAIVPPSFPVPAPVGGVTRETGRLPDIFRTKAPETPSTPPEPPQEIALEEVPAEAEPDHSIAEEAPPAERESSSVNPESCLPEKKEEPEKEEGPDDRREFLLTNGERVFGKVLSESADEIYLQHASLGVLTIPQTQVAKRLLEVILINGDRVVGDVVAETTEAIYIRHTSLGVLTIPRSQRSTRVVEAILKDGDRIIGEVLTETENYTVIRSAALGTVAVQHDQLALLNRKVEQIQPRTLLPES